MIVLEDRFIQCGRYQSQLAFKWIHPIFINTTDVTICYICIEATKLSHVLGFFYLRIQHVHCGTSMYTDWPTSDCSAVTVVNTCVILQAIHRALLTLKRINHDRDQEWTTYFYGHWRVRLLMATVPNACRNAVPGWNGADGYNQINKITTWNVNCSWLPHDMLTMVRCTEFLYQTSHNHCHCGLQ